MICMTLAQHWLEPKRARSARVVLVVLVRSLFVGTYLACRVVFRAHLASPLCLRLYGRRAFGASACDWRAFGAAVVIHVGPHKTGSTTVQSELVNQASLLEVDG